MTETNIVLLFSIMLLGGLTPGVSSLAVLSRSASSGFIHGMATTAGIISGDIIFVVIAIYGLTLLVKELGVVFEIFLFAGAAYVIYLGTLQWQYSAQKLQVSKTNKTIAGVSFGSSFITGLFITLADQKAIFFYFGLFPAMINVAKITRVDIAIILVITVLGVGSAKMCYTIMGGRANYMQSNSRIIMGINKLSGALLIMVGAYIMLTT